MEIKNPSPIKLILWVVIVVAGVSLVVNIGYSTYTIWRRRDMVRDREMTVKRLEQEQIELKNQLSNTLNPSFIEEEARNKLGFAKTGEVIILLPDQASKSATTKPTTALGEKKVWREWFDLFWYGG
jgi:cell division protein FtsB